MIIPRFKEISFREKNYAKLQKYSNDVGYYIKIKLRI